MLKKYFNFKDFDGHYIFTVFGIKIGLKHKCNFKYRPALEYGVTTTKRVPNIIVSLTSHPARINSTHLSINTILRQTFKPDRIILWLAEEQFPEKEISLPQELLKLLDLGLEIRWTSDIKSYKKLIPALEEFPNDIIITADDDIYYEEDWLESLYKKHLEFPDCIICQRPRRLCFNNNAISVLSSRSSENLDLSKPDYLNQMLGGTGCLYIPNSLHPDIFDLEKIQRLLPTNDDIYFWAMAVLKGTKIALAKGFNGNIYQMDLRESSLGKINTRLEQEEKRDPFEIMTNEYPEILERLDNCN